MKITPFALERYFARYEFSARYLLSSSDCEALTQAEVLERADAETKELWDRLSFGYTESPGLPLLRREIAGLYGGVSADEVLEVVPEEGILLAMRVLLEPGDHVVATFPGYQSLYQLAADMGCEVSFWRPEEQDDGWRFGLDGLRGALRPATKLVVVNFPHNPTGALPSADEFSALVDLVAESGARLFCDEMYRFLELGAGRRLPSAVELSARAVALCGLSKSFAAPGLRLGWLVTHDAELLARLAVAKDYTTICAGAPSEILGVMVLRDRERVLARNLELVSTNVAAFEDFAGRHADLVTWAPPRAGSICFPRLAAPEGAAGFCTRLVEETGVMVLPATVFDYDDAHVRIGLGRSAFREGLGVVEEWLARPGARAGGAKVLHEAVVGLRDAQTGARVQLQRAGLVRRVDVEVRRRGAPGGETDEGLTKQRQRYPSPSPGASHGDDVDLGCAGVGKGADHAGHLVDVPSDHPQLGVEALVADELELELREGLRCVAEVLAEGLLDAGVDGGFVLPPSQPSQRDAAEGCGGSLQTRRVLERDHHEVRRARVLVAGRAEQRVPAHVALCDVEGEPDPGAVVERAGCVLGPVPRSVSGAGRRRRDPPPLRAHRAPRACRRGARNRRLTQTRPVAPYHLRRARRLARARSVGGPTTRRGPRRSPQTRRSAAARSRGPGRRPARRRVAPVV